MTAFYNENDPFAAAWLGELIKDGQIADGVVDDRSIEDLCASDLVGFKRVHLFGGVGVWDYALNEARWPKDWQIWTASCPCPPFSSAGKTKSCPQCASQVLIPCPRRTGFFICCTCAHAWFADGRHLWPEVWRLVRDGRPDIIVGEQVSSADGRVWLDLVRASLEILGYAVGVLDTCASGHGAPHIRHRLYWCALGNTHRIGKMAFDRVSRRTNLERAGSASATLVHAQGEQEGLPGRPRLAGGSDAGERLQHAQGDGRIEWGSEPSGRSVVSEGGASLRDDEQLGHHHHHQGLAQRPEPVEFGGPLRIEGSAVGATGLVRGRWADADWIFCRDGKWRPIKGWSQCLADGTAARMGLGGRSDREIREALEAETFPLAKGEKHRVGKLRGYGNALVAPVAIGFIEALTDVLASS